MVNWTYIVQHKQEHPQKTIPVYLSIHVLCVYIYENTKHIYIDKYMSPWSTGDKTEKQLISEYIFL